MLRNIFLFLTIAISLSAAAQKFGYVDHEAILADLPAALEAKAKLNETSQNYRVEFDKLQAEMDRKFQEYQALGPNTPESIKKRRQQEIEELDMKIQQFRATVQQELESLEQNLMTPVRQSLEQAIRQVGQQGDYICIFNRQLIDYSRDDVKDLTSDVRAILIPAK